MPDLMEIAEQVWQVRDMVSEGDDCAAAQLHTIYNRLVVENAA